MSERISSQAAESLEADGEATSGAAPGVDAMAPEAGGAVDGSDGLTALTMPEAGAAEEPLAPAAPFEAPGGDGMMAQAPASPEPAGDLSADAPPSPEAFEAAGDGAGAAEGAPAPAMEAAPAQEVAQEAEQATDAEEFAPPALESIEGEAPAPLEGVPDPEQLAVDRLFEATEEEAAPEFEQTEDEEDSAPSELPAAEEEAAAPAPPGDDGTALAAPEEGEEEEYSFDLDHPLVQEIFLHPANWRLWPAIAVLRWMQRQMGTEEQRLVYRSRPSLDFSTSEIDDVAITGHQVEIVLNAPSLAGPGSPLPTSDIERIILDHRTGGAISTWLDGFTDRFMQAVEAGHARYNPAFALATGGSIEALDVVADLVGRSAPLVAGPDGELSDARDRSAEGAVGFAGLFVGPISASGLATLFETYTTIPARVEEFTGAEVIVMHPAFIGGMINAVLGEKCMLPTAGIEVHMEGGTDPEAIKWARDPERRKALGLLAHSYIGSSSPEASVFLDLDPGNAPPAALDGGSAFGGMAVLGVARYPVSLPLAV